MSHLPFTLLAYFLNSLAVTVDKFLLTRHIPDPLVYIFYFSLFSLVALLALPVTHLPPNQVLFLASASTLLWTSGAYFMFKALRVGQISRVIPVIGTFIPLILLVQAVVDQAIGVNEIWAVSFLILGLVVLTLPDWKGELTYKEIVFELLSATLFALSYILIRKAYLQWDFVSVLVWSRMVLIPVGIIIFLIPNFRRKVFGSDGANGPVLNIFSKAGLLFLFGQAAGGSSELLITFSVALANPALVNSIQGTQYIFLFMLGLILSRRFPHIYKERLTLVNLMSKGLGILLVGIGLFTLAFAKPDVSPDFGVTYSTKYAKYLGVDPKTNYPKMLDELGVKHVRFPIYWDEVEPSPGKYDFSQVDYYFKESEKRDVKIMPVVGFRQPRWPECHTPGWARDLEETEKTAAILTLVEKEISHLKTFANIENWQIENEPLLDWGLCDPITSQTLNRLKAELNLAKTLDQRPIILTDSGELSSWVDVSRLTKGQFAITVYRTVWTPYLGLVNYPLPPIFYRVKSQAVKTLTGQPNQATVVSELQAEPWITNNQDLIKIDPKVLEQQFPVSELKSNISYAKETGFPKIYLWGIEWWYYMRDKGYPGYLDYAKTIFD